jgi:hypothetical protein
VPQFDTIKSYLVQLGFKIDDLSRRNFEDALKRSTAVVERYSTAAVTSFAMVGGAFATAAAAVVGGTVAMGLSVANSDLQYQLLGRRLFMTTDAVRKMDMATKALGVTLPEIIFGPPELQERYHQLMMDETKMLGMLGSDQGEKAFRRIRDIEFQFTRLGPALQIFAMRLTEDVINKMFGGTGTLEDRMTQFVNWFEKSIPDLSDKFSNVLVPAIKKAGSAVEWLYGKSVDAVDRLRLLVEFAKDPGRVIGELAGSDADMKANIKAGPTEETTTRKFASKHPFLDSLMTGKDYKQSIIDDAVKLGIPPGLALAIADKESGMNPYAPKGKKGEIGMFQLMPDTIETIRSWKGWEKFDPNDPYQNIWGGLAWLQAKPGPTWEDKARQYNGRGSAADTYQQDVIRRWHKDYGYLESPEFKPMSGSAGSVGPVTIHINQPNATPEQIHRAVRDGIAEHQANASRRAYPRAQGAYV